MNERSVSHYVGLRKNDTVAGENLERTIVRLINNKEEIPGGATIEYTERREGVKAEHDIRTDKWAIAQDAADRMSQSVRAERESREQKEEKIDKIEPVDTDGDAQ